jgi:hypothetical protein
LFTASLSGAVRKKWIKLKSPMNVLSVNPNSQLMTIMKTKTIELVDVAKLTNLLK